MQLRRSSCRSRWNLSLPYRMLYSKNIENLYFAGRNVSASPCSFWNDRVMATCAILGEAAGTAAAMASELHCSPEISIRHISMSINQKNVEK